MKKLKFGTSGLRDTVENMTDLECYINTRGFLKYLMRINEFSKGDKVAIAGDHRKSTPRIKKAVALAVISLGGVADDQGRLPSPALIYYAMTIHSPGIMVTGSHIPDDRNGIKFSKSSGEVLKSDEKLILECVENERGIVARERNEVEIFKPNGMFLKSFIDMYPAVIREIGYQGEARKLYIERYVSVFKGIVPNEKRKIFLYQHSSVSRDILIEVFSKLNIELITEISEIAVEVSLAGQKLIEKAALRSDAFIPVDTESVSPLTMAVFKKMLNDKKADIGITTDGDGDRPLIVYRKYDNGKPMMDVEYITGDILGVLTVQGLELLGSKVDRGAVPVSANDAIESSLMKSGVKIVRTKIGSPYVIAQMNEFVKENRDLNIVSWEANGGFLTANDLIINNMILKALPSRDALLPLLCVILMSFKTGKNLFELVEALPKRYTFSDRKKDFPIEKSTFIINKLSPVSKNIREIAFEGDVAVLFDDTGNCCASDQKEALVIKKILQEVFTLEDGFSQVKTINYIDGIRITFENGEISHLRPSGNAPEFRNYAMADTQKRAKQIVDLGIMKIIPKLSHLEQ